MNHLKAIFSGMLLSLSVITPGAAAGVSEGTILLSGSVVNAACEVSVPAAEQPQDSIAEGELVQGRLPQSMGRTSYTVLNEERRDAYLRVDYF